MENLKQSDTTPNDQNSEFDFSKKRELQINLLDRFLELWDWVSRRVETITPSQDGSVGDYRKVSIDLDYDNIYEIFKQECDRLGCPVYKKFYFYVPISWMQKNSLLTEFDLLLDDSSRSLVSSRETASVLFETLKCRALLTESGEKGNLSITQDGLFDETGIECQILKSIIFYGLDEIENEQVKKFFKDKKNLREWINRTSFCRRKEPINWTDCFENNISWEKIVCQEKEENIDSVFFRRFSDLILNYTPLTLVNLDELVQSRSLIKYKMKTGDTNLEQVSWYRYVSFKQWNAPTKFKIHVLAEPEGRSEHLNLNFNDDIQLMNTYFEKKSTEKESESDDSIVAVIGKGEKSNLISDNTLIIKNSNALYIQRHGIRKNRSAKNFEKIEIKDNYAIRGYWYESLESWQISYFLLVLTTFALFLFCLGEIIGFTPYAEEFIVTDLLLPVLGVAQLMASITQNNSGIRIVSTGIRTFFINLGLFNSLTVILLLFCRYEKWQNPVWGYILIFILNFYILVMASRRIWTIYHQKRHGREHTSNMTNIKVKIE